MRLGSYVIHDERCKRCGRCARVCAAGAISVPEGCYVVTTYGTASIDQSKCTGCGACAKACKLRAISKKFAINL